MVSQGTLKMQDGQKEPERQVSTVQARCPTLAANWHGHAMSLLSTQSPLLRNDCFEPSLVPRLPPPLVRHLVLVDVTGPQRLCRLCGLCLGPPIEPDGCEDVRGKEDACRMDDVGTEPMQQESVQLVAML
eukprot:2670739-Amphidinium_carterae.1